MIPKSMSSTPIGDGHRFSDQVMPKGKRKSPDAGLGG
jgi:hypothetical protein